MKLKALVLALWLGVLVAPPVMAGTMLQCSMEADEARSLAEMRDKGVSLDVMIKLNESIVAGLKLVKPVPEDSSLSSIEPTQADVMRANLDTIVIRAFGPIIYGHPEITPDMAGAMALQRCLD